MGYAGFSNKHLSKTGFDKRISKKITEFIIIWLKTQQEIVNGAEGILLTDDISGLVSSETYKEFLFPLHCYIREKFKDYIFVFHCDTKSDHILEFLPQIGIDVFNLGPTTDLANAKKKVGKEMCLMGNIDPVNIMQNKDTKIVKEAAEECVKAAMDGGGYLLSAGGGLNENTPLENINILVDVVKNMSKR